MAKRKRAGTTNAGTGKRAKTVAVKILKRAVASARRVVTSKRKKGTASARFRRVKKGRRAKDKWKQTSRTAIKKNINNWATKKVTRGAAPVAIDPFEPGLQKTTGYAVVPWMSTLTFGSSSASWQIYAWGINPYDPYYNTGGHIPSAFTKLQELYQYFEVRKVTIRHEIRMCQYFRNTVPAAVSGTHAASDTQVYKGPFEIILQKTQDNVTFPRTGGDVSAVQGYYKGEYTSGATSNDYGVDWSRAVKQPWFKRKVLGSDDKSVSISMTWTPADYNMTEEAAEDADFRQDFSNFNSLGGTGMNQGTTAGFWLMIRPMSDNPIVYRPYITTYMEFTLLCQKYVTTPVDFSSIWANADINGDPVVGKPAPDGTFTVGTFSTSIVDAEQMGHLGTRS